jgi:hypothetical protein
MIIALPRLAVFCLTLLTVLALGSGGLVMAARQNEPGSWAIFSGPDGDLCDNPCVFGIQPDLTPLSDAERLLAEHPFTRGLILESRSDAHRYYLTPDESLRVTLRFDGDEIVSAIQVGFTQSPLNYGESLALLGAPELVRFAARDGGGFLSLRYESNLVLSSYQETSHFYPDQAVLGIDLNQPTPSGRAGNRFDMVQFIVNEFPVWRGFGSIMRYVVHPECRRPNGEGLRVCHL